MEYCHHFCTTYHRANHHQFLRWLPCLPHTRILFWTFYSCLPHYYIHHITYRFTGVGSATYTPRARTPHHPVLFTTPSRWMVVPADGLQDAGFAFFYGLRHWAGHALGFGPAFLRHFTCLPLDSPHRTHTTAPVTTRHLHLDTLDYHFSTLFTTRFPAPFRTLRHARLNWLRPHFRTGYPACFRAVLDVLRCLPAFTTQDVGTVNSLLTAQVLY